MTDLNHIELPASLLADFYKNHLVEPVKGNTEKSSAKKEAKAVAEKTAIQYLGKNQKGVCVLVSYTGDVHVPDTDLNFLTNILQACKLNLGDVAIINCNRQKIMFSELEDQLSCKQILLFGITPTEIGLPDAAPFTVSIQNNCQFICSSVIDELNSASAESKSLKSKLWTGLKQMFSV